MRIELSGPSVYLELPKGKIGAGWELVPVAEPTEASDETNSHLQNCKYMNDNYIMLLVFLICYSSFA